MLLPLELHRLTMKQGYLSPELAAGWRIGNYVKDFFDSLQDVQIAAAADSEAVFALAGMIGSSDSPDRITVADSARPWDFLFYHAFTGTCLRFILIRRHVRLPQVIRALEPQLGPENPEAVKAYQAGLDLLVQSILNSTVDQFCMIRQVRCRKLPSVGMPYQELRCFRCRLPVSFGSGWEVDGEIRCRSCCGLEPSWLD